MMSNFDRLFFDEAPLLVRPALAVAVGLEESIILQQLHYWLTDEQSGREYEGDKWIYNTYKMWHSNFPFLSTKTIGKIFRKLEAQGLIVSGNFNNSSYDRTKWYRLDYQAIEGLSIVPKRDNGESQIGTIDNAQKGHCSLAKTTTEIASKITLEKPRPAKPKRIPYSEELKSELLEVYKDLPDASFQIDLAMAHDSAKKYSDMNLFLRNWLNRARKNNGGNNGRPGNHSPASGGEGAIAKAAREQAERNDQPS